MIAHRPETTVFCFKMISVKDGYSFRNRHFFYVNGTTKTIPSAIFASRWTFEVPQSHPCWKSCGSSGQLHPHSVATPHQAAHLCLESSVLLLSCSGDKRAWFFVVLHVRKQQQNREQQLIRHAAIWKKRKKTQRAAELQKKRGGENSSREKPVGVWLANHTLEKQSLKTTNVQQQIHLIISVLFFLGRVQKLYEGWQDIIFWCSVSGRLTTFTHNNNNNFPSYVSDSESFSDKGICCCKFVVHKRDLNEIALNWHIIFLSRLSNWNLRHRLCCDGTVLTFSASSLS